MVVWLGIAPEYARVRTVTPQTQQPPRSNQNEETQHLVNVTTQSTGLRLKVTVNGSALLDTPSLPGIEPDGTSTSIPHCPRPIIIETFDISIRSLE